MKLCPCHGVPMMPHPSGRGGWCRVKKRERDARYLLTDKGRARVRRYRLAETTRARQARIQHYEERIS